MKKDLLWIKGDVWPYDVCVALGIERKKVIELMEKRFYSPFNDEDRKNFLKGSPHGRVNQLHNNSFVLWVSVFPRTPKEFGWLQHEIFHAADLMLRFAGMHLDDASDEAWAYLVDFLTRTIYKEFKLV